MAGDTQGAPVDIVRRIRAPVAVLVAVVVAAAWYVTWATADFAMAMMAVPMVPGVLDLVLFFALMVLMMVAMMLPSALPMILAFHGMTRLEAGRPIRPPNTAAMSLFVLPYFLVWGGFALLALLGVMALGLLGPLTGALALAPAGVLIAAGAYQFARVKEVCLTHCQSPMSFVMHHWRSGRMGALRMGLRHSLYCIGCCWLFMLVLFVAGAMSLPWMGLVSVLIFAEKVGRKPEATSRSIAVVLIVFGIVLAIRPLLGG